LSELEYTRQPTLQQRISQKFRENIILYIKEVEKHSSLGRSDALLIFKWKSKMYEKVINHVLREEIARIFYNESTQRVELIEDPKQHTLEKEL